MRPKRACDLQPGDYIGERVAQNMVVAIIEIGSYVFCYMDDESLIRLPANLALIVWDNEIERLQRAVAAEVERRQCEANQRRADIERALREFDDEFLRVERQRRLDSCANGGYSDQPPMADMLEKRRRLRAQLR